MRDLLIDVVRNLRANRLRSVLTMFGIAWGVVAVVVLSATGEGFRRGNEHVLQELGRNVVIVFGGRTSAQAGGERAGRRIYLTLADARALATASRAIAVVSPEIQRTGVRVKSPFNAGALTVDGMEPAYQRIRTIAVARGRLLDEADEAGARRVALVGADAAVQLFGRRDPLGANVSLDGFPYTVVGVIRKKEQDSSYNGQDNEKLFVPFAAIARDFPRTDAPDGSLSQIVLAPAPFVLDGLEPALRARTGRVDDIRWPLHAEVRRVLASRHRFDPDDQDAVTLWDTNLQSLMFGRMIDTMRRFFSLVGLVTLGLGGIGVMNIMLVAVRERTREIGVRKALGATTRDIQLQFLTEGMLLTLISGAGGFIVALVVCGLVNQLPMPSRFQGMTLTWEAGVLALAALGAVAVAAAVYPATRASRLPPVEALRFEA